MKSAGYSLLSTTILGIFLCGCGSDGPTKVVPPVNITVAVSAKTATLAATQTYSISATSNDSAGVTWTATGGSFSSISSLTGQSVTYTAPSNGGSYMLTATSVTSPSTSASAAAYVTDLPGVFTYHNDLSRDGANTQEYALTPTNVNTSSFGKLTSCPVDGAIYAQPLWVPQVTVGEVKHNIVVVATEHDSLYAFDAEGSSCTQLWSVSLIDTKHGATAGETTVPSGVPNALVGHGSGDIAPEVGVTGTPVIDPSTNTLYVVSKSANAAQTTLFQRLHAIDISTGNEKSNGPANLGSNLTFPGTGDGGTTVTFNPGQQNQRGALAFNNGTIYITWSSHEDAPPYYGWVASFNASNLSLGNVLNVSPNVHFGGIWMGGGAPAFDNNNNLYLITGNADFDADSNHAPNTDYGDSLIQLSPALAVNSYFTPSDEASDDSEDGDFGSGGSAVLLNATSGSIKHLLIGGGKDSKLYVVNGDNLGGYGDSKSWQKFSAGDPIFATGAFWNNNFYIAPIFSPLATFAFNPSTSLFDTTAASQSSTKYGFPGATPSISAMGSMNGIVWALDAANYCTQQAPGCGPAVLHAYSASSLSTDLWNSSMVSTDAAGNAVKFAVPTVANGRVYVGTRGNNTGGVTSSTSAPGELDVYGLKPN